MENERDFSLLDARDTGEFSKRVNRCEILTVRDRKNQVSSRNLVIYARARQRSTGLFWEACVQE